jgi:membrane-associated protease RseP (regulator of RpoE activity)
MDGFLARGGAVALLTIGVALPAGAQGTGAGRMPRDSAGRTSRDTILRIIAPTIRAQLDSITVLMRLFDGEPVTSETSIRLRQELESAAAGLVPRGARIVLRQDGQGPFEMMHARGYIGITTGGAPMSQEIVPSGRYVQYFAHPAIVSVDRDSPAQLAGIVAGDSLIAYDGVDVVGRRLNLNQMLMPERRLGVTVRRGGDNKEYQITVARAPMAFAFRQTDPGELPSKIVRVLGEGSGGVGGRGAPRVIVNGQWIGSSASGGFSAFTLTKNGVFGASMITLDAVLAKSLDRPSGVLVTDVPESTVAGRAGLRAGDVIVSVAGQAVATLGEVQVASVNRAENRMVALQVIREKKPRTITVSWGEPPSP